MLCVLGDVRGGPVCDRFRLLVMNELVWLPVEKLLSEEVYRGESVGVNQMSERIT